MGRVARLDQLTALLRARGSATMKELSEALGVSTRTIRRDVALLRERGVDIEGERGRGGGVRFARHATLPPIRLSEAEVVALYLSMEMMRRLPGMPFSASCARVAQGSQPLESALLVTLEEAFSARRVLSFGYADRFCAVTARRAEPHGLLARDPVWYLLAYDSDKEAPRAFRLDRMLGATVLSEGFTPRPDLVDGMSVGLGGAARQPA